MLKLKDMCGSPRRVIRYLSVLNLVLVPTLYFVLGGEIGYCVIVYSINISTSMLMLMPDTYKDSWISVCFAAAVLATAVGIVILCVFVHPAVSIFYIGYGLAGVPLSVLLTIRAFRMMDDPAYISMKISGWEMLLCMIHFCYLAFFLVVLVYSLVLFFYADAAPGRVWPKLLALLMSLSLFLIMYARSCFGSPIISFTKSGKPAVEKDGESCAFLPEKLRKDYKKMYASLCNYLETEKPFLGSDFSLDTLARAMCSNKAYVSRLINACAGMNFNQLMNQYRVRYAKNLFMSDTTLRVKDLADMSGFNSQVSFNMAFKLFCEITPGEWCKDYRDSIKKSGLLSSREVQEQKSQQASS